MSAARVTPMRAGIRLAGTYEFGGDKKPPTTGVIKGMLKHVAEVMPGIDAAASSRALARIWSGEEPEIDMAPYAIDRFGAPRLISTNQVAKTLACLP